MSIRIPHLAVIAAASVLAAPAAAQVRAPTPRPAPQPGVLNPDIDPASQGLSALALRLDAVEQAARRQVVVLEHNESNAESWPRSSDNFDNNNARSEDLCRGALGDRFGRVISRHRTFSGDRHFLHRVVCETR